MSYAAQARRILETRPSAPITEALPYEINERNEKRSGTADPAVWWADPILAPLPADADDRDRAIRADFAPILSTPPTSCIGPTVCSRVGVCDRHAAGRTCRVEGART